MSSISVQPINSVQSYNVQFNGQPSNNAAPYHKSNTGLIGGLALSVPAALDFLPDLRLKNSEAFARNISDYSKDIAKEHHDLDMLIKDGNLSEGYKSLLKKIDASMLDTGAYKNLCKKRVQIAVPAAIAAVLCTIGSGVIIDAVRNKKAKETAQQIASAPNAKAICENKNVAISDEGIPYYNCKVGRHIAPIFGALCGAMSAYLNDGLVKNKFNIGSRAAIFAAGGLIAGTVYDGIVNKREKHKNETVNYLA